MDKLTINDWIDISHDIAVEHGWWKEARNDSECLMLMVSELAECQEAMRLPDKISDKQDKINEELADLAIRLFDYCGGKGIDLEKAIEKKTQINRNRIYKHGKKF